MKGSFYRQQFVRRIINIIAKPVGPICNLDCRYCFYLNKEGLYPGEENWVMSEDVLEEYIKQYIKYQDGEVVNFIWQGGEPALVGLQFYEKAVKLQEKYKGSKKIENSFQTNGILLDDKWCDFFVRNNFLVGVSIDGPQYLHDKYRLNKGGKPTFDSVLKGIDLLKKHSVEFNTLTVVNRDNSYHPLENYNFLKDIGSGYMQFIPAVEKYEINQKTIPNKYNSSSNVTEWSVEPVQYGNFLCEIFDEWVRNDIGNYFIQIFDVALEAWYGMPPGLCIFSETCGSALAIEHNGDLYSCDHFVYPENKLGNINQQQTGTLIFSKQQIKFGQDKKDKLPDCCLGCKIKFACNGGCPKDRFINVPGEEFSLNYLCEGYKHFFTYISPYMKFMVNELIHRKSPANVMEWIKGKGNDSNLH